MKKVVTRIAPSPTGKFCHIGNVRTLLYNYFLAKKFDGKFLVRLEDTDRDRYTPEFLDYFKNMCNWLGIIPDASYWNPDPKIGSFTQSERDYSEKIKYLIDNGFAYYAFDTKDDLDIAHKSIANFKYDANTRMSMKNSLSLPKEIVEDLKKSTTYVIRFKVDANVDIKFNDAILGDITINTNTLDDKVLLKSNGIGSYHLCNVCDDHDMEVSHVLRGQEWVNSTPFHILLYKAFGWDIPIFAHLPLIMNPDGKGKLSKRTAAKYGIPIAPLGYDDNGYNKGWKDEGYDPLAFINTLALIGWNPGNELEIMDLKQMISLFSLDRVHKSGARFDMDKAKWINSQYVKNTPNPCLLKFIDIKDKKYSDDKLSMIIDICKERSNFKKELNGIAKIFFNNVICSDNSKYDENYKKVMTTFIFNIGIDWNSNSIKDKISEICTNNNIKLGKIMPGLRNAITGGIPGPDLMTTMFILGREETFNRIKTSL